MESAKDWYYPDIESARRFIPHCAEVSVFTFLPDLAANEMLLEAMDDTDSIDSSISSSSSMAVAASLLSAKPKPFSQGQLNDLVCDFALFKESSEILYLVSVNMVNQIWELKLHSILIGMIC